MADQARLENIAPTTLQVDINIRTDARLTKEFVASVKAHGVLVPIMAVENAEGIRVRMGHRRTLAAIEAGLETVPVRIVGDERTEDDAQIERILMQYDENEQRAGLTNAEKVGAVEQLAAFGLSANQIAKRSRIKRDRVDAALSVAGSDLAKGAVERYEFLAIDQAATVAEFEDDAETVKALVSAAQHGRFDHVAQRARDERREQAERATAAAPLVDAGLTVIERPAYDAEAKALTRLHDAEGNALDPEAHKTCPGHVVWVERHWATVDAEGNELTEEECDELTEEEWENATNAWRWQPVAGCSNPKKNGHQDRYAYAATSGRRATEDMTEEEREEERQKRRLVRENNAAWDSAESVRREWVKQFLTRKTQPKGAPAFLAQALLHDAPRLGDANGAQFVREWTGSDRYGLPSVAEGCTPQRAQVLALAVVLASYEGNMNRFTWRCNGEHEPSTRYLAFLSEQGYELSEVEEYAMSDQTA